MLFYDTSAFPAHLNRLVLDVKRGDLDAAKALERELKRRGINPRHSDRELEALAKRWTSTEGSTRLESVAMYDSVSRVVHNPGSLSIFIAFRPLTSDQWPGGRKSIYWAKPGSLRSTFDLTLKRGPKDLLWTVTRHSYSVYHGAPPQLQSLPKTHYKVTDFELLHLFDAVLPLEAVQRGTT